MMYERFMLFFQQSQYQQICKDLTDNLKAKDEEIDRLREDRRDISNEKVNLLVSYFTFLLNVAI